MANGQIVVRRKRPKETRVQNSIIWDKTLSTSARFSLIAMLSLPDSWDYSVRGMAVMLNVSKDTMSKYIKELETAGYLKRKQIKCEGGRFSGTQYILTDTPGDFGEETPCPNFSDTAEDDIASPCPNFSAPEKPAPEKSPQKKRNKEKNTTEEKPPKAPQRGAGRKSQFELDEDAKPVLRSYCANDPELTQAMVDLIEIRTRKKAVNSKRAIISLLKDLDRLSGGRREDKLLLIRQSVANSWKSVFPLKGRGAPPPPTARREGGAGGWM